MERTWYSGAIGIAPSLPGSPSTGYPTDGDPLSNLPPTIPGARWFHMITEELRAVVVAAGLTPDPATLTQLLTAMQTLFGKSLATKVVQLPGGKIMQWGTYASDFNVASGNISIAFPISFPTACDVVMLTPLNTPTPDAASDAWVTRRSISSSGFTFGAEWAGLGGYDTIHGCDWLAVGR